MKFRFRRIKTDTGLHGAVIGGRSETTEPSLVVYAAPRAEVAAGDINGVRNLLKSVLLTSPESARRYVQSLLLNIQGYDEDPRELYEIEECRRWFQRLDEAFPYLIYFLPCQQYSLYVGSQSGNDGSRLTINAIRSFFRNRKLVLVELGKKIGLTEKEVLESLQRAVSAHMGEEIELW